MNCCCLCAVHWSAPGPLRSSADVHACEAPARRGRQCPLGAHAVAVGASRRLRCGARPSGASQNSLRSLRSLRSNSCDESDHEARCARRLKPSAPRRHRNRPHRALPAALWRWCFLSRTTPAPEQRRVRAGWSAPLGRREAQRPWPRAKRESSSDSSQLFERSERSERSEFCDGAAGASIAGQSAHSADRSSEALRAARTRLCRSRRPMECGRSRATAMGREQTPDIQAPWVPRGAVEVTR